MSYDEALSSLQTAIDSEHLPEPVSVPEQDISLVTPQEIAGSEVATPASTEAANPVAVEDSFTSVDPNTLPPELQAIYKSLQGDYTRKTQETATLRKQYESFGSPESVQEAIQFVDQLQNPLYLKQFHGELTTYLQTMGLSPAAAAAEATAQIADANTGATAAVSPELASYADIPELAPVATHVSSLEARLAQMEAESHQRVEAEQAQRLHLALVGEIQRQETAIRHANPAYEQADIDAIYELGSYYDGNLLKAQSRYEEMVGGRIQSYLAQKGAAAQIPDAPVATYVAPPEPKPLTLSEGHAIAMERLRLMEAQ